MNEPPPEKQIKDTAIATTITFIIFALCGLVAVFPYDTVRSEYCRRKAISDPEHYHQCVEKSCRRWERDKYMTKIKGLWYCDDCLRGSNENPLNKWSLRLET